MLVKICGISNHHFLQKTTDMNFDLAGFIFYPESPRYVGNKVTANDMKMLPEHVKKVGVFVNSELSAVIDIANNYSLDYIQLHGNESPEYTKQLSDKIDVIKAFRIGIGFDFELTKQYKNHCSYFLFDTYGEQYGGTGLQFDWNLLADYTSNIPFILSGGIGPGDAEKIGQFNHPMFTGIDINSRFEISPGIKTIPMIRNFLKKLV